jgi:catechol 2,3-dioxygenase-like lactoylglutathione lyase family enzyme
MTDVPPVPPLGETPEVPVAPPAAPEPPVAPRRMRITGIHHVTLICADLERTTAFYRDVLGLALWREAANDDDPGARHFWFAADPQAAPGTLLSFLEYPQMGPGTQGTGATHHLALAVGSPEEVAAWRDYLRSREIPTTEVFDRGGLSSVYLRDPDGHILELTAPAGA